MTINSLLPVNASELERELEQVSLGISQFSVPIKHLWDPKKCPKELLVWLAWSLSVDEWDANWPEEIQRKVIADSIPVHRQKGTVSGVRKALASLDANIELTEWWQNNGIPHTAELTALARNNLTSTGDTLLTAKLQAQLWRTIAATKPVRSNINFSLGVQQDAVLNMASAAMSHNLSRQYMPVEFNNDLTASAINFSSASKVQNVSRAQLAAEPDPHLTSHMNLISHANRAIYINRANMMCQ